MQKTINSSSTRFFKSLLFVTGLFLFAGFSHLPFPLFFISLAGLLISAYVIISQIRSFKNLNSLFDWHGLTKANIYYLPVSLLIGILFGLAYRNYLNLNLIPLHFTGFAFIALAIGSTEEFLFRGYFQSQIRKFNVLLSILLAICAHTIYKLLIFIPFRHQPDIEILFIIKWTLMGGLLFALLKEISKNTAFPVISHAFFDLLVYGDRNITPWWVWS